MEFFGLKYNREGSRQYVDAVTLKGISRFNAGGYNSKIELFILKSGTEIV